MNFCDQFLERTKQKLKSENEWNSTEELYDKRDSDPIAVVCLFPVSRIQKALYQANPAGGVVALQIPKKGESGRHSGPLRQVLKSLRILKILLVCTTHKLIVRKSFCGISIRFCEGSCKHFT